MEPGSQKLKAKVRSSKNDGICADCSGLADLRDKEKVVRYSDVNLPPGCDTATSTGLHSQPEKSFVTCRNHLARHGNAGKRSNNAKSEAVLQKFLEFVDSNSGPNDRNEGSHGATYYFNQKKFTFANTQHQ